MSFDVYGVSTVKAAEEIPYPGYRRSYRRTIELACRCHECSRTTVFVLEAIKGAEHDLPKLQFETNENPTKLGYRERRAFPPSSGLPTPSDTPEPAASFFGQGAIAMTHDLFDAAGAMFRKCLESVTRSEALLGLIPEADRAAFQESWLKARITKLKEIQAIPPALGDLVDVIKDEGDDAVHDNTLYDKDSAHALQQFTSVFLEQTFTIPAQIARVRAKSQPRDKKAKAVRKGE